MRLEGIIGALKGTNYSINEVLSALYYRVKLGKLTQPSKPYIAYFYFRTPQLKLI